MEDLVGNWDNLFKAGTGGNLGFLYCICWSNSAVSECLAGVKWLLYKFSVFLDFLCLGLLAKIKICFPWLFFFFGMYLLAFLSCQHLKYSPWYTWGKKKTLSSQHHVFVQVPISLAGLIPFLHHLESCLHLIYNIGKEKYIFRNNMFPSSWKQMCPVLYF